jgi:hypothetical protein
MVDEGTTSHRDSSSLIRMKDIDDSLEPKKCKETRMAAYGKLDEKPKREI